MNGFRSLTYISYGYFLHMFRWMCIGIARLTIRSRFWRRDPEPWAERTTMGSCQRKRGFLYRIAPTHIESAKNIVWGKADLRLEAHSDPMGRFA